MKKRVLLSLVLIIVIFLGILILTNPSEKDYKVFYENEHGRPYPDNIPEIKLERIDFVIFSTYTPVIGYEHGITYLGILDNFFQISDGQFDYPKWLELFN